MQSESYDGESDHSILIMDNCSIHHVQPVLQTLMDMGILVLFFTSLQSRYESHRGDVHLH